MAPELIAGKPASTQSDIYSLGLVLYQLLTGDFTRPVTTDWANDIADPLLKEDLKKCFAGNPQERFDRAGQLATNLRSLEQRRAERAQQEAAVVAREKAAYRRGVIRTGALATLVVLIFAMVAIFAARQRRIAIATLSPLQVQKAEKLFAANDPETALAYLARALRQDPYNRVAAERLISALSLRNFAVSMLPPLQHKRDVIDAQFSLDGRRIVTASVDKSARVWDAQTSQALIKPLRHSGAVLYAEFSPNGNWIATASNDQTARVWENPQAQAARTHAPRPHRRPTCRTNANRNMKNLFTVFLLLCVHRVSAVQAHAAEAQPAKPNIVIIFIDDMGYADIGPFGATKQRTPNLDRMAKEGRKFTNFHVPQPVCSASRAGLLTGCYPNRIGIHGALGPSAKHGLADTEMTIAELLKQKGYATGMAGKWHLGTP